MNKTVSGVWAASITPIGQKNQIDNTLFFRHINWLLNNGCHGVVIFGTTGEAASFSVKEREDALFRLIESGIPSEKLLVGTGCSALADTIDLSRQVTHLGCAGALVLPPFFYRNVSTRNIFDYFKALIEEVGAAFNLYLYHFPEMSGNPVTYELIDKLLHTYSRQLCGIKDSGGDFEHMSALTERYQSELNIFSGDDHLLLSLLDKGGAGSITATANLFPHLLREIYDAWSQGISVDKANLDLTSKIWRDIILQYPVTEALKGYLSSKNNHEGIGKLKLPLCALETSGVNELVKKIDETGFAPLKSQAEVFQ